jgi:hypothetical protein
MRKNLLLFPLVVFAGCAQMGSNRPARTPAQLGVPVVSEPPTISTRIRVQQQQQDAFNRTAQTSVDGHISR